MADSAAAEVSVDDETAPSSFWLDQLRRLLSADTNQRWTARCAPSGRGAGLATLEDFEAQTGNSLAALETPPIRRLRGAP